MAKFASTLLGLTLITACSASSADAGLFDWFDGTQSYRAPRAAVSYTTPSAPNGYSLGGPDGCVPCVNGQCATPVRPAAPYGYNAQTPTYNVQTPSQCFPTSTSPTTTYYGNTLYGNTNYGNTNYGNSSYGNAYSTPCATGTCPTAPYAAPYAAPNAAPYAAPYHTPVNTPVNGSPYFGSY